MKELRVTFTDKRYSICQAARSHSTTQVVRNYGVTPSTMKPLITPRWYTTLHVDNHKRNKAHLLKAIDRGGITTQSNGVYVPTGVTSCGKKVYQSLHASTSRDTRCKICEQIAVIKLLNR